MSSVSLPSVGRQHLAAALSSVLGIKALILDEETTAILSSLTSQNELLAKDIALVERLGQAVESGGRATAAGAAKGSLRSVPAVFFLRATDENVLALIRLCKAPRHLEHHIFFTNAIQDKQLARLARYDAEGRVKRVRCLFFDFVALTTPRTAFSLGVGTLGELVLAPDLDQWQVFKSATFERVVQGLFSAALQCSQGRLARVHYSGRSSLCRRVAGELAAVWRESGDVVEGGGGLAAVIVMDRLDDPVTPLLLPWTYQAMIHEQLQIENGRVTLPAAEAGAEESEIVLHAGDDFFDAHWNSDYGAVGAAIKDLVQSFKVAVGGAAGGGSSAGGGAAAAGVASGFPGASAGGAAGAAGARAGGAVGAFGASDPGFSGSSNPPSLSTLLTDFPSLKRRSDTAHKHGVIGHLISSAVAAHNLMAVSLAEQELVRGGAGSRAEHFRLVSEFFRAERAPVFQKIKLLILFALRYEDDPGVATLRAELRAAEPAAADADAAIDAAARCCREARRSSLLFQGRSLLERARSSVVRSLGATPTGELLQQHTPYAVTLVEKLALQNRQAVAEDPRWPCIEIQNAPQEAQPAVRKIILFVVGGITFAEIAAIETWAKRHPDFTIYAGGTRVHNSKSFIADLVHLAKCADNVTIDVESGAPAASARPPANAASRRAVEARMDLEVPGTELTTMPPAADSRSADLEVKRNLLKQGW